MYSGRAPMRRSWDRRVPGSTGLQDSPVATSYPGLYRVAAINPEFSFSFFDLTHHSWKPYDFIELKTGWQKNILRINSYNKTAFSSDDSLDQGPELPAGLRHGVPVEGPHHLPGWSSGSGPWFSYEALLWPSIQRRHTQNSSKGCIQRSWEVRSPSPTPLWGSSWANPASSSARVPVHCVKDFCLAVTILLS